MNVPRVLRPFDSPARQADDDLEIVRGDGGRLWVSEGRSYLDGTASLWYGAAGHGHRQIRQAGQANLPAVEAWHTFGRFSNPLSSSWSAMGEALTEIAAAG